MLLWALPPPELPVFPLPLDVVFTAADAPVFPLPPACVLNALLLPTVTVCVWAPALLVEYVGVELSPWAAYRTVPDPPAIHLCNV